MPRPTRQDAQVLLTLMDIFLSNSVREARKWWRSLQDGLSLEEFEKRFPQGERRMGTLLDDGDLLGDGGFTHATRTSPGGSRLRHIHGCPTLGKGRTDRSRPPQAGESSRRG